MTHLCSLFPQQPPKAPKKVPARRAAAERKVAADAAYAEWVTIKGVRDRALQVCTVSVCVWVWVCVTVSVSVSVSVSVKRCV